MTKPFPTIQYVVLWPSPTLTLDLSNPAISNPIFRLKSFQQCFQVFSHAILYCTFLLLCFIQSSSFQSLNIKASFLSHSENKDICIFIRVLLNSFVLSNLLKSNIIHEILTSPTYAGTLPRARVLRLHSYIVLHMVQIFISYGAICCFQAPYQVQHIHYKTTIHTSTTVSTTTALYAYSHLLSVEGYCSLSSAQMKYSIQEGVLSKRSSGFGFS